MAARGDISQVGAIGKSTHAIMKRYVSARGRYSLPLM